jgi:hypothetical protein
VVTADRYIALPDTTWQQKYRIITETYGFDKNSFEASATTHSEAFWQFNKTKDAMQWLKDGGKKL